MRHLGGHPRSSKAVLEGRPVFLDAATTLGKFMVDGLPDSSLFDEIVGSALRKVRENGGMPVCAPTERWWALLPGEPALQSALTRATDEVLGPRAEDIRDLFQPNHRPSWAVIPATEAMVLSLRHKLPDSASQILERVRRYYEPLA